MTTEKENKSSVLIVDDDEIVRSISCDALTDSDFIVHEAVNGKEALTQFERVQPDIVLLDIAMPVMDGFQTCAALRQKHRGQHIPILMVTSTDDYESIQKAYEVGATDFITKPFNSLVMTQRVRYMLRASKAFEELRKSRETLIKAQRIAKLGSWELDIEKNAFYYSEEILNILKYPRDDIIENYETLMSFIHPDDMAGVNFLMNQAYQFGTPFWTDHRIVLTDGSERFVTQHVEVLLNQNSKPSRLTGALQDITERKMAEFLEIDRSAALTSIVKGDQLDKIFQKIIYIIERQKPHSLCAIFFINSNKLYAGAATEMPHSLINAFNNQTVGPKVGCVGAAAYSGDTIFAYEIEKSPVWANYRELALSHNIKSSVSMPVFSGKGQVIGVISMFHKKNYFPDRETLRLLEMVGKLASISLEKHRLGEQLTHQAQHDSLTGLPNRLLFEERLAYGISQALRYNERIAALYIDLDRFKHINDSCGYQKGDLLIKEVADRLASLLRDRDTLARISSDEFILFLKNTNRQGVATVAAKILELVRKPFKIDQCELHATASVGISIYPDDGQDGLTIQRNADIAMYYAKNQGGNRFLFFNQAMRDSVVERLDIENELRKAIKQNEFQLYYQPQCDLANFKIIGVEALLRWKHHELGFISPVKFIPIAEESGLIVPLGKWVIHEACRQNAQWQRNGLGYFKVAVNVSAIQLIHEDFYKVVESALNQSGLDPKWLELEITESVLIKDMKKIGECFSRLQKLGLTTAIDDFGTGYSSMSYLKGLPVNYLKIDRSFVMDIGASNQSTSQAEALVRSYVTMARNLKLQVVAEGIETQEQLQFLRDIGCDIGQGYFISVPLPAQNITSAELGCNFSMLKK